MNVAHARTAVARLTGLFRERRRGSPDRPLTVDEMLPREGHFSVGNGDFKAIGLGLLEELKQTCDLAADHHVLDVGCGTGRIAIPLTQHLSPAGSYDGFDAVKAAVRHCRERITPSYPNFRFQDADIQNRRYNRRGRIRDHVYRFPYPDRSFDVVFVVSVFTHLLPAGTERYLGECVRVLKPGGRFFASYFLLNEASSKAIDAGRSTIPFRYRLSVHRVYKRRNPEAAVAYDESFIAGLYDRLGLELKRPADYGVWSGRPASGYGGYQDVLVATRPTGV